MANTKPIRAARPWQEFRCNFRSESEPPDLAAIGAHFECRAFRPCHGRGEPDSDYTEQFRRTDAAKSCSGFDPRELPLFAAAQRPEAAVEPAGMRVNGKCKRGRSVCAKRTAVIKNAAARFSRRRRVPREFSPYEAHSFLLRGQTPFQLCVFDSAEDFFE